MLCENRHKSIFNSIDYDHVRQKKINTRLIEEC